MLSVEFQREDFEEIERVYRESLTLGPNSIKPPQAIGDYINVRNMQISYPFKHSLLTCGSSSYPCTKNCNPRRENEIFVSKESACLLKGFEKNKNNIYTEICGNFNSICFPRCGDKAKYPDCCEDSRIDVRLFSSLTEFEEYYLQRPENLLRKDSDFHTESLKMHEILRKIFESSGKSEIVKKINAIL